MITVVIIIKILEITLVGRQLLYPKIEFTHALKNLFEKLTLGTKLQFACQTDPKQRDITELMLNSDMITKSKKM